LKIFVGRANRRQFGIYIYIFIYILVCSNRNRNQSRFVGYIWGVRKNRERERREREKIVHLVKRLISGVNLSFYFHVLFLLSYTKNRIFVQVLIK